jgi:hypothetical protein
MSDRGRMKIKGIDGLSQEQIQMELQQGAKFVMYQYCISVLVMTFKRPSGVYFVRAGAGSVGKGLGFSGVSMLLGWWGIPWGPIYTLQSFWVNFRGGRDVTREIMAATTEAIPQAQRA